MSRPNTERAGARRWWRVSAGLDDVERERLGRAVREAIRSAWGTRVAG